MALSSRHLTSAAIITLASLGTALPLAAATTTIEVRFVVLADEMNPDVSFAPAPRESLVRPSFATNRRSPVYEYRGPNPIEFTQETRLPPDAMRPSGTRTERVVVGRAIVPPGVREALLLFSIEPGWELQPVPRFVVQVFDDSRTATPPDHIAFLNATGRVLFGHVGASEVQLPVGLSRPIRFSGPALPVSLFVLHNGEAFVVHGGPIALDRNQRALVVLFPPLGPESTQVRRCILYDPDRWPQSRRETEGQPR